MARHEFILRLNRKVSEPEVDALFEAGCDDAGIETGELGTLLDFTREAPTLAEALVSAVRDIEKVPGLRAIGVACNSLVTAVEIAERAGVTREAVRLWATGQRRAGEFPAPALITTGNERLWDWTRVAGWLTTCRAPAVPSDHVWITRSFGILCAADRVLAAREALASQADDATREELERLLQDA